MACCSCCYGLLAQENVVFKTLKIGETFTIQINLDFSDDILVLSRLESDFFTNVSSTRSQNTVEFSLTARKSGKTIISIDNVSQDLVNFLTYQIDIEGPRSEEAKSQKPKRSNQLLVREAYLKAQEVIESNLWELAEKELAEFKSNFSDAKRNYWLLVKNLYEQYQKNNLTAKADELIREYLEDSDQFPFLDEAKLLLAQKELAEGKWNEALTLLFDISKTSAAYKPSLLEKGKIYQQQEKNKSALNAYLDYLSSSKASGKTSSGGNGRESYSLKELPEVLMVLLEVGKIYETPPINDFQKAFQYYRELYERAQENNDFAMQERALNRITFLEKHYVNIR